MTSQHCVHGCGCRETDSYLFFHCQIAKALWFATPWSIKWDLFENNSLKKKLLVIVNSTGVLSVYSNDKEEFFILATLILEHIWTLQNLVIFENYSFSLDDVMSKLKFRFQEVTHAIKGGSGTPTMLHSRPVRSHLPLHCTKINTNAAIKDSSSMIAVIARDQQDCVLKIKVVSCQSDVPEVAELLECFRGCF